MRRLTAWGNAGGGQGRGGAGAAAVAAVRGQLPWQGGGAGEDGRGTAGQGGAGRGKAGQQGMQGIPANCIWPNYRSTYTGIF